MITGVLVVGAAQIDGRKVRSVALAGSLLPRELMSIVVGEAVRGVGLPMTFAEMHEVRRRIADLPCVCVARRRDDEEWRRELLEGNVNGEVAATAASSCVSS